jgi:hypothetical protein
MSPFAIQRARKPTKPTQNPDVMIKSSAPFCSILSSFADVLSMQDFKLLSNHSPAIHILNEKKDLPFLCLEMDASRKPPERRDHVVVARMVARAQNA